MSRSRNTIGKVALLLALIGSVFCGQRAAADVPRWPASSVIYCVYPSIFSPQGNFAGVTAELGRLKTLGVTVIWLMPVTPIGHPIGGHPAFDSPYCVHDYFAINPAYGSKASLRTLVTAAHKLGLQVILDEVLNHTSWDNPLITQHPDYYVHSDGSVQNPASIVQAFNFGDVAQLNYANPELRAYMTQMLRFWLTQYHMDGFRFDTADNPGGPGRLIPADFWQALGSQLRQTKPDVLLLGECQTPDLALKPFALDYAWRLYGPLKDASGEGGDASQVEAAWQSQATDFPPGMMHMALQDDWDTPRDVNTFGGGAGALAVAVFNYTSMGVPLLYNGMEIGNTAGATNPHAPIDWPNGDLRFTKFYQSIIALRRRNPALTQGTLTWLPNTAPKQVLTYKRTEGGAEFLVEINLSSAAASGAITAPPGAGWAEVPLASLHSFKGHTALPKFALPPKDFAIYRRAVPNS